MDGRGQPEQNTRVVQLPDHGQALKLLVVATSGVTEFDLGRDGDYTVGRSPTAEVWLDSASVSRAHALLVVREGQVSIQDLRSTNGTFLNGSKIGEEPEAVGPGDALRFGDLLAQLRGSTTPTERQPRLLGADEFADRMAEESERAVRFGGSFALLAVEANKTPATGDLRGIALPALRAVDVLTVRTPERVDILIWLMKMTTQCEREMAAVSFLSAWLMRRACRPTWASPISPSSSALGVKAATESMTMTSMAFDRTSMSAISSACSPQSGCDTRRSSSWTPSRRA